MTPQGIVVIDILALGLIVLLVNLVRKKKLYVSYAVIWVTAVVGMMLLVSIPPALELLPKLVGAIYPASALSLLAFIFIFVVLIFMSVKFSILSDRQTEIIQLLAIRDLEQEDQHPSEEKS
jgi:hypothetical protein